MSNDWILRVCLTLDDIEVRLPTVDVGEGAARRSADFYVLAEGPHVLRFDLRYRSEDYRHHTRAIFWRGWFAFGFGDRAILWRETNRAIVEVDLGSYFGEFLPRDDYLLVTSGQGIVRLDAEARIVWRNDELGLDGVLIADVENGSIVGQGEWDPPGGWREFAVSLGTGKTLDSSDDGQKRASEPRLTPPSSGRAACPGRFRRRASCR